jgi:hypothetical protein
MNAQEVTDFFPITGTHPVEDALTSLVLRRVELPELRSQPRPVLCREFRADALKELAESEVG